MKYLLEDGEAEAVREVVRLAHRYGYGNMIAHLRSAWALCLSTGMEGDEARSSPETSPYPMNVHLEVMNS